MAEQRGPLLIIGGHEDKKGEKKILREIARRVGEGKLVVTALASQLPDELHEEYEDAFRSVGIKHVYKLRVEDREDARKESTVRILDDADAVFFTGGDQLRITSQIGDTPTYVRINEIYQNGGLIAGTSAGASVMCETMLVSGNGTESHKLGNALMMAPGLGFIGEVIIDQHFAERGRMGRLLGAIAQNPKDIGLGIDENTAIVVEQENRFFVIGDGAVYVVDGSDVTYSNIVDGERDKTLSIHDVRVHLLSEGDRFDLNERRPLRINERVEKLITNNH